MYQCITENDKIMNQYFQASYECYLNDRPLNQVTDYHYTDDQLLNPEEAV